MIRKAKTSQEEDNWTVYVLECSDGTFYTGITSDLSRRLKQHNAGTASRYTRGRLPVKIRGRRNCPDKSSALKMEYRIKQLPRREKLSALRGRTHG
jgi:predicted GIY-YIG superfamily endonuclease